MDEVGTREVSRAIGAIPGRALGRLKQARDEAVWESAMRAAACQHDGSDPLCNECTRAAHPWP